METFISDISKEKFPASEKISGNVIKDTLLSYIQKDFPNFNEDNSLSISELNEYREKYITDYMVQQLGVLNDLERTVLESINDETLLTNQLDDDEQDQNSTFGQKIADKVAAFGGSWTFIISFVTFLLSWIGINAFVFLNKGFDPYPFILLNLILSCVAALQAPVIMMSQNRQEEKDRERAKKDYMINLKAELQIRILNERVDHLVNFQQQQFLTTQGNQTRMISKILEKISAEKTNS